MATYYDTLGIDCNAEADAIRTAWKRVARDTHPDRNPDDPKALERFLVAKEAYETLSNDERRAVYDTGQAMALLRFAGRARCTSCGATAVPGTERCVRCAILEHNRKTAAVVARTRDEMIRLRAELAAAARAANEAKAARVKAVALAKRRAREKAARDRERAARAAEDSVETVRAKGPSRTLDLGLGSDVIGRYRLDELLAEAPAGLSSTGLLEALLSEAAIRSSLGAVDPVRERAGQTVLSFVHGDTQVQLRVDPGSIRDVNGTLRSVARVMAAIRRLVG
jgi:hypothetical protein